MTKVELILRLGASSCFLGHGVLAMNGKTHYVELLISFGIPESAAMNVLFGIGCLDVLVAVLLLLKPHRFIVYWAVGWTAMTITAWAIQESSLWDIMRRVNYTMIPLALLFLLKQLKNEEGKSESTDDLMPNDQIQFDAIAVENLDQRIIDLDLSKIKMKIMQLEEGEGWTQEQADQVELEYRRFLQLQLLYPLAKVVPNRAIDIMWHYHILDTETYQRDCQNIFGTFMHHYPYYGMNGKADEEALHDSFDDSQSLYERTFGESMNRPGFLSAFNNQGLDREIIIG